MQLSVALPVFSETESVIEIVNWLKKYIRELYEVIIIISPKSSKESKDICNRLAKRDYVKVYTQKNNPGLGNAYREGIEYAKGDYILMLDSDGEMSLWSIPLMIDKINQGFDGVVGSRFMKGGGVEGYNPLKLIYNKIYQFVVGKMFRTHITDLSLGFKMMRTDMMQSIKWEGTMHEFATESTLLPIKKGFVLDQVPAQWKCREQGVSKNKMINNLRYPKMAWKIWLEKNTQ